MININDYDYNLPEEKIALYPLPKRDESKLLVYKKGNIEHHEFKDLSVHLPGNSFLFFNDTRVIPARIKFQKETGAEIEVFLLSPVSPSTVISEVMQGTHSCAWQCTIGNLKRWKEGTTLSYEDASIRIEAT